MDNKSTRQYKCGSCGGEMELHNGRSKYVSCPYCGTVAEQDSEAYKILTKNASPDKFKPKSFLKLGLTGKYNGKQYKIIGRTSWKSTYKEYWSEDGESGYSDEVWTFDDWLLIDEFGGYMSIIEDREGYTIAQSFMPKYPSLPKGTKCNDFDTNGSQRVREYGTSEILYYEGESTYLVQPGNTVSFSQYTTNYQDVIAEWRHNVQGEVKEIEFFKETPISKAELQMAFASQEQKEALKQALLQKIDVRKKNKRIFKLGAALNLVLGLLYAFVLYPNEKGEQLLFEDVYTLKNNEFNSSTIKPDSTVRIEFASDKSFTSPTETKEIKIELRPSIAPETEGMFTLQIFDNSKKEVFRESLFSYDYKSYKNGQPAKKDDFFKSSFDAIGLAGNFYPKISIEMPKSSFTKSKGNTQVQAKLKIWSKGVEHSSSSFFVIAVILFFISILIRVPKQNYL